jgi:hypothetical protein
MMLPHMSWSKDRTARKRRGGGVAWGVAAARGLPSRVLKGWKIA